MGVNASQVKKLFDGAAAATLRAVTAGSITSTTTETAVSLNELRTAYWHNYEIPNGVFAVTFHVTARDFTTGDETYSLSLLVDDVIGMNNSPVTIDTFVVPATGVFTRYINSADIAALDSDHNGTGKYIAVKATLAGTTPILTYGAWIGASENT